MNDSCTHNRDLIKILIRRLGGQVHIEEEDWRWAKTAELHPVDHDGYEVKEKDQP